MIKTMVTINIPTALRPYSQGREHVQVDGDASLRAVFERLEKEAPGIRARLMAEDGQGIHPGIAIFINDDQESEGLIQRVPSDATIHILPAMGGGSV
jgi:molybdopterin converting factor small subunit